MPNEQLAWIDPFIYQEWPVRLAHQMNADTKATKRATYMIVRGVSGSAGLDCVSDLYTPEAYISLCN